MTIDRIGKGPKLPDVGAAQDIAPKSAGASNTVEAPFATHLKNSAGVTGATAVRGSAPLEALRRGEIDLKGYVDQKVTAATAHLEALPVGELNAIREMLRDKLASDPELAALTKTATGSNIGDVDSE